MKRPSLTAADVALTFAFALTAALEYGFQDVRLEPAAGILVVLAVTPLMLRSVAPVASVAAAYSTLALAVAVDSDASQSLVPALAPLAAVYSAGMLPGVRPLVGALAAALVPATAIVLLGGDTDEIVFHALLVFAALAVGRAVSVLGFESEVLEARAAELERERDVRAAEAVAEERARIARELHDVIGHSISVMGVQAGAVRRKLKPEQEREREALLAVERTGRDAVAEMRRLLGFLRSTEAGASVAALPTLGRVEELAADMRRAGLDVDLRFEGPIEAVSPGRELAAFRIVQEALTNVLKHAPGAHVEVLLRADPAGLEIVVRDDGDGAAASINGAGGQGLVGMRERVAMYGGSLTAGPVDGAGFEVRATLPAGGA